MLFLSIFVLNSLSFSQVPGKLPYCDCSKKSVTDSLIERYIRNGTQKLYYNTEIYQTYCDSLINICPNIAIAYQQKALPFIKNGDYASAFPLEDKAVELDPKSYMSYRAFLKCIFTKDYKGAIIDFQSAEKLNPNGFTMDHTYFFYQGLCNLELENYERAKDNFGKDTVAQITATGDGTIHFNTLLYLGILFYELKDNTNAKIFLMRCLKQYKELPEANYYLALIFKRENNFEAYNNYLQLSKDFLTKGYTINEDNTFYANYPHQITLYEIDQFMH